MTHIKQLENCRSRLDNNISNRLNIMNTRIQVLKAKIEKRSPERTLFDKQQRLADTRDKLQQLMERKHEAAVQKQSALNERMHSDMDRLVQNRVHRYEINVAKLHALAPTAKLINGFGYISKSAEPVRSVKDVKKGDRIAVTLSDGSVTADIVEVNDSET